MGAWWSLRWPAVFTRSGSRWHGADDRHAELRIWPFHFKTKAALFQREFLSAQIPASFEGTWRDEAGKLGELFFGTRQRPPKSGEGIERDCGSREWKSVFH